ncbi:uncharacterized protein [Anser cygnoides]|uniref:uncharacterized protein n=1 Tax=Anser cygnoides TaxID=8845 RepID=UPI0034D33365
MIFVSFLCNIDKYGSHQLGLQSAPACATKALSTPLVLRAMPRLPHSLWEQHGRMSMGLGGSATPLHWHSSSSLSILEHSPCPQGSGPGLSGEADPDPQWGGDHRSSRLRNSVPRALPPCQDLPLLLGAPRRPCDITGPSVTAPCGCWHHHPLSVQTAVLLVTARDRAQRRSSKMLSPGLSLVYLLCVASLLPSSLGCSSRPSWATLMWDVAPEDLEHQGIGTESQCSYLPYLLGQLWSSLAMLDAAFASMEVLYRSDSALCLLGGVFLVGICFWRKARRCQREEVSKTPSASSGTCCHCGYSYDSYEMLCRMEGNIVLMQKHLRELLLHHPRAGRTQRAKKKTKLEDMEEEESIFSISLESHGSQGGSGRESGGLLPSE